MRRILIVLDNCEHLVESCATLADAVLRNCPDVRILATSRQPLGVGGETIWRVPPLAEAEALQLFVNSAQGVQPGWALTERGAPAVRHVCQRLDGIPLAIEFAAARVSVSCPSRSLRVWATVWDCSRWGTGPHHPASRLSERPSTGAMGY
jgi:predicted ATPase